jgi:hypothetical protein
MVSQGNRLRGSPRKYVQQLFVKGGREIQNKRGAHKLLQFQQAMAIGRSHVACKQQSVPD